MKGPYGLCKAAAYLAAVLGICALGPAEFNLYGVPMLERSAMDPVVGWSSLGVAILCFFVSFALMRWAGSLK